MPLYNFKCPKCGKAKRKICSAEQSKDPIACSDCSTTLERAPSGATSQVKERLDNGLMPRAVERLADAERLFKERAQNHDPAKE